MWDERCHKDDFSFDFEADHCLDPAYVHQDGCHRPASFLGFCHGDDFWDPQHGQKLAVGQTTAAIGHLVAVKHPGHFHQMQQIIKAAHPGVPPLWCYVMETVLT